MIQCNKVTLERPDPWTGLPHGWTLTLADGRELPWRGVYTGPLTLGPEEIDEICHSLLGFRVDELGERVDEVLRPVTEEQTRGPAVILHSTTPELKTFEGQVHALSVGAVPLDATTYKETRSPYLARPGDLAVGRTRTWKMTAKAAAGVEAVELPDRDHYYLSHALLHLAARHQSVPVAAVERLVSWVQQARPFVKLYALEKEMQVFLLWLARAAGLERLSTDANRPAISAAWNRKSVLHPTVAAAQALESRLSPGRPPAEILGLESRHCHLARAMGIEVPTVPGYTLERAGRDEEDFVRQLLAAARLLQDRYGLSLGCLKASESGDGARITPGLPLAQLSELEELGREAHRHGDDYLLEAHVHYLEAIAGQDLPTAISAHVRGGQVAEGATLQFVEGTSWKGNLYLDERTCAAFRIEPSRYGQTRSFMDDFVAAFQQRSPGLVTGGIDFALGTIGGAFGDEVLLGVQDLNISFTGAECLRAFLDKARGDADADEHRYGVTRIYRPRPQADLEAFLQVTEAVRRKGLHADAVASIPGRWAMVGIAGASPAAAMDNLHLLRSSLAERELIEG